MNKTIFTLGGADPSVNYLRNYCGPSLIRVGGPYNCDLMFDQIKSATTTVAKSPLAWPHTRCISPLAHYEGDLHEESTTTMCMNA